jgi:hypothetical protein
MSIFPMKLNASHEMSSPRFNKPRN